MKKGFTLLEIIVVIVVAGIIAGIAVPQFFKMADKAVWVGGLQDLTSLYAGLRNYWVRYGGYPDDQHPLAATNNVLGVDVSGRNFTYELKNDWGGSGAGQPVIIAIRNNPGGGGWAPCCWPDIGRGVIAINAAGKIFACPPAIVNLIGQGIEPPY